MKKLIPIIPIVALISVIGISIFLFTNNNYAKVIKNQWRINLTKEDRIVYSVSKNKNTYQILKYNSDKKIEKLNELDWIHEDNEEIENGAQEILNTLEYKEEYTLYFNKDYSYIYKEKNNKAIYLFYIKAEKQIYVIEKQK